MSLAAKKEYDNLIAGIEPGLAVDGKVIRKTVAEVTYERGTVFGKSSKDGKIVILGTTAASGETITADCILCDDVTVGADEDVTVVCYTQGCFNTKAVKVNEGYTMTEKDMDNLRAYGIVFKAYM